MAAFASSPLQDPPCPRCRERGYYPLVIQPERAGGNPIRTVMFCACLAGQQLRQITIEFRLSDLRDLAQPLLNGLKDIKSALHTPDEAGKKLDATIRELEALLEKLDREERSNEPEKTEPHGRE